MIITRTPLRISLAGGGSDLPAFLAHESEPGVVLSAAIDKYVTIVRNPHFGGGVRLSYSRTENVAGVAELQHDLARECLKVCGVESSVEVVSVADVPAGTGLGSSGAYTVGLLKTLYPKAPPQELAWLAAKVEIEKCGRPVGRQDQWASAFGGLREYRFFPDGRVSETLPLPNADELFSRLMLFYLGQSRDAAGILAQQAAAMDDPSRRQMVRHLATTAWMMEGALIRGDLDRIGWLLDQAWFQKRQITSGISSAEVDCYYSRGRDAGALGGKLCGAGGSGFLLLYVPPDRQESVRQALGLRELHIGVSHKGSEVIYTDERD